MNKQKLKSAISAFITNKNGNAAYNNDNWAERKERKAYYQSFTRAKLLAMSEDDFVEYLSRLWSMLMWGFALGIRMMLLLCMIRWLAHTNP